MCGKTHPAGNPARDETELCRQFFLQPTQTLHRRFEVLRAFFVEGRAQADIAAQFGLSTATVQSLVRDFRAQVRAGQVPPFFSSPASAGPQAPVDPPRRKHPPLPTAAASG